MKSYGNGTYVQLKKRCEISSGHCGAPKIFLRKGTIGRIIGRSAFNYPPISYHIQFWVSKIVEIEVELTMDYFKEFKGVHVEPSNVPSGAYLEWLQVLNDQDA